MTEWKMVIEKLYDDILNGRYTQTAAPFENLLTKVQKYKLKKQRIPDIFIVDL